MKNWQLCIAKYVRQRSIVETITLRASKMSAASDSFLKWENLLRFMYLSGRPGRSNKSYVRVNLISAAVLSFEAIRLGFSSLLDDFGVEHLYGHSPVALGSFWKLFGITLGFGFLHVAGYRITFAYLDPNNLSILKDTVAGMCSRGMILRATIASAVMAAILTDMLYLIFYYINIQSSETTIEIIFWSVWTAIDLIVTPQVLATYVIVNCIVCLVMINHWNFCNKFVSRLAVVRAFDLKDTITQYTDLKNRCQSVNKLVSPVITCTILFSSPVICILVFLVSQTSDGLQICLASMTVIYSSLTIAAVYLYAKLNSISNQVRSKFANQVLLARSLRDKLYLLSMMEDLASDISLCGMYAMDGTRYDVLCSAKYFVEIATNYILILTFRHVFQ